MKNSEVMDIEPDNFYLELRVTACQMGKDNIWMQGDLEIRFNSDGKPYADSDIIDIGEFFESLDSEGEFKIFSCCCGIPECSGWIRGIQVRHLNQYIEWTNLNNRKTWVFEKESLQQSLEAINQEVENYKIFFKEKGIDYVGYNYDEDKSE